MQTNRVQKNQTRRSETMKRAASSVAQVVLVVMLMSSPAFAQLATVNSKLSMIQAMLVSIGGVTASIAILWAAYKMMFQAAKWGEISNVVIGGVLAGSAVAFGAWIVQ